MSEEIKSSFEEGLRRAKKILKEPVYINEVSNDVLGLSKNVDELQIVKFH